MLRSFSFTVFSIARLKISWASSSLTWRSSNAWGTKHRIVTMILIYPLSSRDPADNLSKALRCSSLIWMLERSLFCHASSSDEGFEHESSEGIFRWQIYYSNYILDIGLESWDKLPWFIVCDLREYRLPDVGLSRLDKYSAILVKDICWCIEHEMKELCLFCGTSPTAT